MNILLPTVVIFVVSVFVIELCFYAYRSIRNPNRQIIRKRLKNISYDVNESVSPDIARKRVLSDVPLLNKILLHIPGIQSLERLLRQANVQYPLGFFILLTGVLIITVYLGSSLITRNVFTPLLIAASLGAMPFLYLRMKKKKRMGKFQRQLPDGLELIARALRAGHAFTTGMKLAADEFGDPLGPEFDETLDEINFGISVSDALKNLVKRIDCPDLKYFIVSVILQRETGGNLSEIIESISHLIRERFKFNGKIRTLSAEGKLSAIILVTLPFLLLIVIHLINPSYISTLFSEPIGRKMVGSAAFMMAIGSFVIKRMVNIKV